MSATDGLPPRRRGRRVLVLLVSCGTVAGRALSLGFLTLGGFACGVMFWGGFNTAMEFTNTETFCLSCHEMRNNVFRS